MKLKQIKRAIQKGFTLIELMIVVAIIGILAAVALPAYQDYTVRAQVSEAMALTSGLKTAVADYFAASGVYPADLEHTICGDSGTTNCTGYNVTDHRGNYVAQMDVDTGTIIVQLGNKANDAVRGKSLSMKPGLDGAKNISWVCGYAADPTGVSTASAGGGTNDVEKKFLPNSCK